MVDSIVEIYLKDEGWFRIDFEDLKPGMLFRMFEPLSMNPVIYDDSDRWIVVKPPFFDGAEGKEKITIRRHLEIVGKF